MKTALGVGVLIGVPITLVAYRLSQLLSPDAIAMAIGLFLGVGSLVPTFWLVSLASRRDAEDDYSPPPPQVVYRQDVTPYTNVFRGVAGMPQLPDRQAEIKLLRDALEYLEGSSVVGFD